MSWYASDLRSKKNFEKAHGSYQGDTRQSPGGSLEFRLRPVRTGSRGGTRPGSRFPDSVPGNSVECGSDESGIDHISPSYGHSHSVS